MRCPCCLPRLLAILLLAVGATSAAAQTTWYVDAQASPPGLGSQAQPYTSIQYAIAQPGTLSGDTLLVSPGEYVENVSTLGKSLSLLSVAGPLETTIRSQQPGTTVYLLSDCQFSGFTVVGWPGPESGEGIYVFGGTSYIRNCIVRDHKSNGIASAYDAYVFNCTVTGCGIGVVAHSFGGSVVMYSSIVGLNGTDLHQGGGGFLGAAWCLTGNLDGVFWNYAERDLRLRPGSPAINAGNPSAPLDPDGSVVDAGALTYDSTYAPGPSVYCTGKLSSQGCTPAIGALGSASASSATPFLITAAGELPNVPGLLFFGFGPRAAPFQGGLHCVVPPTPRVGGQLSLGSGPCSGTYSFDMGAYIQSGVYPALVPGALVYCQWWNRDLQDPAGFGTGLTNALHFGIAP